ncbi:MAG: phage tail protein I [Clostridiales bacterium]|nr:MAG: phage tail protein I [Clostridiales bacterium]
MSKTISQSNMMLTFPSVLAEDKTKNALAKVIANELCKLYADHNLLAIYSQIDKLDGDLLDILARDFNIDWWDADYTVEEKRQTFKECWRIKRTLGTPAACSLAVSAIFQNAVIKDWWQYGGNPYYFRIHIDLGRAFADYDKIQNVVKGIQYYKNKRSILDAIETVTGKSLKTYVGTAVIGAASSTMDIYGIDIDDYTILIDNDGALLLDENGQVLLD